MDSCGLAHGCSEDLLPIQNAAPLCKHLSTRQPQVGHVFLISARPTRSLVGQLIPKSSSQASPLSFLFFLSFPLSLSIYLPIYLSIFLSIYLYLSLSLLHTKYTHIIHICRLYVHIYIHTTSHGHMYVCTYTHISLHTYICIYIYIYTYVLWYGKTRLIARFGDCFPSHSQECQQHVICFFECLVCVSIGLSCSMYICIKTCVHHKHTHTPHT